VGCPGAQVGVLTGCVGQVAQLVDLDGPGDGLVLVVGEVEPVAPRVAHGVVLAGLQGEGQVEVRDPDHLGSGQLPLVLDASTGHPELAHGLGPVGRGDGLLGLVLTAGDQEVVGLPERVDELGAVPGRGLEPGVAVLGADPPVVEVLDVLLHGRQVLTAGAVEPVQQPGGGVADHHHRVVGEHANLARHLDHGARLVAVPLAARPRLPLQVGAWTLEPISGWRGGQHDLLFGERP